MLGKRAYQKPSVSKRHRRFRSVDERPCQGLRPILLCEGEFSISRHIKNPNPPKKGDLDDFIFHGESAKSHSEK